MMDADGDGLVTLEELATYMSSPGGEPPQECRPRPGIDLDLTAQPETSPSRADRLDPFREVVRWPIRWLRCSMRSPS